MVFKYLKYFVYLCVTIADMVFNDLCMFTGLIDLTFSKNGAVTSKVEHFPPGHVETYNLDTQGRAVLAEQARFHKIGEQPAYPTFPVQISMCIQCIK